MWPFPPRTPPWAITLTAQVTKIQKEIKQLMALVQVEQADLDAFATGVETAVGVLKTYIEQLLANQATPLPAADESAITKALADLDALQPPAPPTP